MYCFIITRDAVSLKNLLSKDLCLILISFPHTESVVIQGLFCLEVSSIAVLIRTETHVDGVCSAAV